MSGFKIEVHVYEDGRYYAVLPEFYGFENGEQVVRDDMYDKIDAAARHLIGDATTRTYASRKHVAVTGNAHGEGGPQVNELDPKHGHWNRSQAARFARGWLAGDRVGVTERPAPEPVEDEPMADVVPLRSV